MASPPALFDADLLALRRRRAARLGPADVLHEVVAGDIEERLAAVNRTFTAPAIVGPRAALWAGLVGVPDARAVPDADVLDLEEGAHDLVVHALALHWANDPVGQLVQARRALRPDGLFLAALYGGETLAELRAALAEAEVETLGGLSPRVAPMGEIRDLGDSRRFDLSYPDALALMRDLRAMGETNVLRDRLRRPTPRTLLARTAAIYAARFGRPDGRVHATFDVMFLTGWAPAADQPKPLRPGSAAARLADALGAVERPAGEPATPRGPR
jgi:SAM-dependent methyltransferase